MLLATPLSPHAVLQHGKPLPVWGWDEPGREVVVRFAGVESRAVADAEGRFEAVLPAVAPSAEGRTLAVAGSEEVELRDVVVGEVWLCSGQSNMEWRVEQSAADERSAAAALDDDPLLRHLVTPTVGGLTPARRVEAPWMRALGETAPGFQAVPFWFGVERRRRTGLPVGLACASWGASKIQAWLPAARLEASGHFGFLREERLRALEDWMIRYQAWERGTEGAERPPSWEAGSQQGFSQLRDRLSGPLMPMALAGVLWYQGESDTDNADRYGDLFTQLLADWREGFRDPRLIARVVQLPNYEPGGEAWGAMQAAQARARGAARRRGRGDDGAWDRRRRSPAAQAGGRAAAGGVGGGMIGLAARGPVSTPTGASGRIAWASSGRPRPSAEPAGGSLSARRAG